MSMCRAETVTTTLPPLESNPLTSPAGRIRPPANCSQLAPFRPRLILSHDCATYLPVSSYDAHPRPPVRGRARPLAPPPAELRPPKDSRPTSASRAMARRPPLATDRAHRTAPRAAPARPATTPRPSAWTPQRPPPVGPIRRRSPAVAAPLPPSAAVRRPDPGGRRPHTRRPRSGWTG